MIPRTLKISDFLKGKCRLESSNFKFHYQLYINVTKKYWHLSEFIDRHQLSIKKSVIVKFTQDYTNI